MTEKPPPNPQFEDYEKDCPYHEEVLGSSTGTITFRDYGDGTVWLGLREGNETRKPPKVMVQLTDRQQVVLSGLFMECRRARRGLT